MVKKINRISKLEHGWVNFFCRGLLSKYSSLYRPYVSPMQLLSFAFVAQYSHQNTSVNKHDRVPIKLYLEKQRVGWIWSTSHSLLTQQSEVLNRKMNARHVRGRAWNFIKEREEASYRKWESEPCRVPREEPMGKKRSHQDRGESKCEPWKQEWWFCMFKCKQGGNHWEEGVLRQREWAWRTKVTAGPWGQQTTLSNWAGAWDDRLVL